MAWRGRSYAAAILAAGLVVVACAALAAPGGYGWRLPKELAPPPVPAGNPMTPVKVELGRRLFYDADLSINGTIACATCHEQKHGFTDTNKTRPGVHGDPGRRNIMGLANVGYFRSLTWGDPDHVSLEAQAEVPVMGRRPVEMGLTGRGEVIAQRLGSDPCYRRMFAAAFPDAPQEISMHTAALALASFQRTLISVDAPFDRYRSHRGPAISDEALKGEALFYGSKMGCSECHAGRFFTDAALTGRPIEASFHVIETLKPGAEDQGLAEITNRAEDAGKFRTPSLRNSTLTGPYLHDGSAPTLEAAIRRHAKPKPDPAQLAQLIAFIETLTDPGFIADPRFALPKPGCPLR